MIHIVKRIVTLVGPTLRPRKICSVFVRLKRVRFIFLLRARNVHHFFFVTPNVSNSINNPYFMWSITIVDTLESSSTESGSDNEANPLSDNSSDSPSDNNSDSLTEDGEELFLYGYFDNLFHEDSNSAITESQSEAHVEPEEEPKEEEERPRKTRRIIKCEEIVKNEVLEALQEFTATEDIVEFKAENDKDVCIFVDLSEEECLLMDIVSSHPSIVMNDLDHIE